MAAWVSLFDEIGGQSACMFPPGAVLPSPLPAALVALGLLLVALLLLSGYLALSRGARLQAREKELAATKETLQERSAALAEAEREVESLRGLLKRRADRTLLVAHELRAPIASIQNSLDVLLQGYAAVATFVHEEMLRLARDRARALLELVNDLLHLGGIRHAEMEKEAPPVQLVDTLWRVVPEMRIKATLRGVDLRLDVLDSLSPIAGTDEDMEQLLSNLIDNAIKYTDPEGTVTVSLKEEADCVIGEVADTGIGIAPQDVSRIFEEFYRAANAKEVEPYGTGLGLPIVKHVVELYGGQLKVESELRKGSRFIFTFPKMQQRYAIQRGVFASHAFHREEAAQKQTVSRAGTKRPGMSRGVLVIGGGISGIQAALDLADMGIHVHLVEKTPSIGGRMAQLDKTFPTNDCAICILSPKLAECSRHPNITLHTYSEVEEVTGSAGEFSVKVLKHARYVDEEKCTACGDCVVVCPITLSDEFNQGLSERTAIYRPYAQAIPNAYLVNKRGTSPCKAACRAETSAQGYVALIAQGQYREALEVVKQYNPFPATVGRVCDHPCEAECNRGKLDEPVAVCALKRFVADWVYAEKGRQPANSDQPTDATLPAAVPQDAKRVAIVGAGPAGLSAAHFLARTGYRLTIFEALPVPGGMMRVGIPSYRLPRHVLQREIDNILDLGVELELYSPISDINRLFDEGYDAVFLAIGAHEPQHLRIPGEDAEGVYHGVPFLRTVNLGGEIRLGKRVLVVGGGNTAIDAARSALRLGAEEVIIAYRRSRVEMPAISWEIEEAQREGVKLELLTQPVEVISENGRITGVSCIRMRLSEPDESGRRRPIPVEGSEFVIGTDALIAAVAQAPEISFLKPDHGLDISLRGTFVVNPRTLETSRPGVFAGGDAARGPGALIQAIADGRRAALSIDRYLRGAPLLTPRELHPLPLVRLTEGEIADLATSPEVNMGLRAVMPAAPVQERIRDFREVELGLSEEEARAEALRCLRCGICSECWRCVEVCGPKCIDHQLADETFQLNVGAIVVASGFDPFDPSIVTQYGYGKYRNVITSPEYERLISASGPTGGHLWRLPDKQPVKRLGFIQCVGSRDVNTNQFCSSVCCMYATKEAILANEHDRDVHSTIFYTDLRAAGKGFQEYVDRAQREYNVTYVRARVAEITLDANERPIIWYDDAESGEVGSEVVDLAVLAISLVPRRGAKELAELVGVELDEYNFIKTDPFSPMETTRPGVFACGYCRGPADIPESVAQASGAAGRAAEIVMAADLVMRA